ncbi:hypothetical protein [Pseudomonas viciae]|uniref:hypothetical protein n=1 Tax=Pseudomonas viciae TaxID=2505979 RepID=UPI003B82DA14
MSRHGQYPGPGGAQCSGDGLADAAAGAGQYHAGVTQLHGEPPCPAVNPGTCRCRAGTPL